jgi:hypothetical protein
MGTWSCIFTILNLGTRWGWMVSFTALLLYPPSQHYGEEKNFLPLPGIESWLRSHPALNPVAIPTELSRLHLVMAYEKNLPCIKVEGYMRFYWACYNSSAVGLYFGGSQFRSWPRHQLFWLKNFLWLSQSLQEHKRMVPRLGLSCFLSSA